MSNSNDEMNKVSEMFDDYEKSKQEGNGNGKKIEDILSKIFVPRNEKEYFRILPPNNNEKIIEKAYFHQVQVNTSTGKKWRKIYCLKHNGDKVAKKDENGNVIKDQNDKPIYVERDCPFCNEKERILAKQDSSLKGVNKDSMTPQQKEIFDKNKEIFKEAQKWDAKQFYIISGIDRLAEKDGKKFWRFKHNYRNSGVLDKLMPVLSDFVDSYGVDFTDPVKGADLNITVVDAKLPNGKPYKEVSAISMKQPSPLHNDSLIAKKWLEDDTSWRDVFKPASAPVITPEEYMSMIIEEKDPYWDDSNPQNKHWVFPGRPDLEEKAKELIKNKSNNDVKSKELDEKINQLDNKIGNLTHNDVKDYSDNHTDLTGGQSNTPTNESSNTSNGENVGSGAEQPSQPQNESTTSGNDTSNDEDFDDLPF